MTNRGRDSERFEALSRELLKSGMGVRFEARGASMSPCIRDGDIVYVTPVIVSKLRKDDIVLSKGRSGFRVHRVVIADQDKNLFITRGDCGQQDDPPLRGEQILGVAIAKEVRIGTRIVRTKLKGFGRVLQGIAWVQSALGQRLRGAVRSRACLSFLSVLALLLVASYSTGQVAVADPSTRGRATLTGSGTVNFTHTTANTTNRLLIVGVAMNITNSPAATVSGVTYAGTALTFIGAHNDAGNTRRVEMWYLLNPLNGNNQAIVVSATITAGQTVGVVAGATTFSGADQTVPLGTFVSNDGAAGASSQLDVPSVINGMILDTLAIGGNRTVATISGPQVQEWNRTSSGADPPGVTSTGSSRTGAPSVPISELFSGNTNWSLGAISINPSTADIGVSTSVSAVPLGQNSTFDIAVTNSGLSAANNVVLTDTLGAGLTWVSTTPSAGTTCVGTTTITCTLPASLVSGGTATVKVVAVQMDHAQGSYFTFPKREEAQEFRRRGLRAI